MAALAEVFADPYAKQFYPNHSQPEKLASWIEWSQRGYAANGFGLWALELLSSGAFAGDAGLTLQRVDGELLLEIGYHIHPSLRQQGLATEAAHACLSWAFEHTNHEVVCCIVHPANAASARVRVPEILIAPFPEPTQLVPYLLCAALWLPWRAPGAATTALVLSALLLLAAVVLYLPMLWTPGARGGDMIGLAFVAISAATAGVLLLASAAAFVVLRLGARARQGADSAPGAGLTGRCRRPPSAGAER